MALWPDGILHSVIKDRRAFAELCERERHQALARMTAEESIAVAEALLTSEAMEIARFERSTRPVSLALSLGLVTVSA